MKNEYDLQAENFAKKHGVKLTFIGDPEHKRYFSNDKDLRWVFKCQLRRHGKQYTFYFGQSISNGAEYPKMYDILACLTKYDPGTLENFCSDYGYEKTSSETIRVYMAVCKEYDAVMRLFGDCIEELEEIQ